jgi:hypothetical protein
LISQNILFLGKFISEPKNGNVDLSKVDALTNIVLSKAEKRVPYDEYVGNTECVTL